MAAAMRRQRQKQYHRERSGRVSAEAEVAEVVATEAVAGNPEEIDGCRCDNSNVAAPASMAGEAGAAV